MSQNPILPEAVMANCPVDDNNAVVVEKAQKLAEMEIVETIPPRKNPSAGKQPRPEHLILRNELLAKDEAEFDDIHKALKDGSFMKRKSSETTPTPVKKRKVDENKEQKRLEKEKLAAEKKAKAAEKKALAAEKKATTGKKGKNKNDENDDKIEKKKVATKTSKKNVLKENVGWKRLQILVMTFTC